MEQFLFFTTTFIFPHDGGKIDPIEVVGGYVLQYALKAICDKKGHTNYEIKPRTSIQFIDSPMAV